MKLKRIASLVLALALSINMFSVSAFATDPQQTETSDTSVYVAQIGEGDSAQTYDTLAAAVASASAGDTITLLDDVTLGNGSSEIIHISNGMNVTLDLNGHTISKDMVPFIVENGTFKVTGTGTIQETTSDQYAAIMIFGSSDVSATNYSTVEVDENVTLKGWSGIFINRTDKENNTWNVANTANRACGVNVTMNGTIYAPAQAEHKADGAGIYINGLVQDKTNYPVINIGGSVTGIGGGIYAAGYAQWNVQEGATITGTNSGIGIKAGILGISDATILCTGENSAPTDGYSNGINASGAAIQVESNVDYAGDIEINIFGGNITSTNGHSIYEYVDNSVDSTGLPRTTKVIRFNISNGTFTSGAGDIQLSEQLATSEILSITGGTFSSDPSAYVAADYKAVANDDSTWSVVAKNYVAQIGEDGDKYETLAAAVAAAKAGDTITLLNDVSDVGKITLPASVTFDGKGKTISGNSAIFFNAAGGTAQNVKFENIHNPNYEQYVGGGSGAMSAIYGSNLTGKLTITGCTFTNCDWDAIQITPKANAEIVITQNDFVCEGEYLSSGKIKQQRFIHVQSGTNVDFSATVTNNNMIGTTYQGTFELYYFTDNSKVTLSGNYIEDRQNVCILKESGTNVNEMMYPLKSNKDSETADYTPVAMIKSGYISADYDTLAAAVAAAKAGDTITLLKDTMLSTVVKLDKSVTINGDGHKISAANDFDTTVKNAMLWVNGTGVEVTLNNVTADANGKSRVILVDGAGHLSLTASTVTGGYAGLDNYVSGVYVTGNGTITVDSSSITGNTMMGKYANDGYLQYSSDLWIGANATGTLQNLNNVTLGNVFVNSNAYSANNPGSLTLTSGTVENLYVEYDQGYGASFQYTDGIINNLYISTTTNGTSIKTTPVKGTTYAGGNIAAPVAKIGNNAYTTLADAFTAANNGDTIVVQDNVTLPERIVVEKRITLDLNGKTIGFSDLNDGMQAFKIAGTAASLTIEDSGDNGKITSSTSYAIFVSQDATLTVNGGTIQATGTEGVAVSGNGNGFHDNTSIFINGGTLQAPDDGAAIYHPQQGMLNINGGIIEGGTALEVKAGTATVSISGDAELIATGTEKHTANSNGISSSGYAVALVKNTAYAGNATVTIAGCKLKGAVAVLTDSDNTSTYTLSITGGLFSVAPANEYYDLSKYEVKTLAEPVDGYSYQVVATTEYEKLQSAIGVAEKQVNLNANNYTTASVEALQTAIDAAKAIKTDATNEAITAETTALNEIVAALVPATVTIEVASNPANAGILTGGGRYAANDTVNLTARAVSGYIFDGWYNGDTLINSDADCSYTVLGTETTPLTLTARYHVQEATNTLQVQPGKGSVRMSGSTFTGESAIKTSFTQSYKKGTSFTVTAQETAGYEFLYWINSNTRLILTEDETYSFYLTSDVSIEAVYRETPVEETTSYYVVFKDYSGKILQATEVDSGGSVAAPAHGTFAGLTFTGWSSDDESITNSSATTFDNITKPLVITAQYTLSKYSVTVTEGTGTVLKPSADQKYEYGTRVTVQAYDTKTDQDGVEKYFSGWYNGTVKVSDKQSYSFCVANTVTLTARYEGEAVVQPEPTVAMIMGAREYSTNGKTSVLMTVQWSAPTGYTVMEGGLIRGYDKQTANELELEDVDGSNVKRNTAASKAANATYAYTLTMGAVSSARDLTAVGYLTYMNDKTGEITTVYTALNTSKS